MVARGPRVAAGRVVAEPVSTLDLNATFCDLAGVAPGFEVLDEGDAQTLLRHAQDEQMEALARPDAPADLTDALASVAGRISVTEYAELMTQLLGERAWLLARIGDEAGLRRLREKLARELGCSPDDSAGELTSGACLEAAFDAAALAAAARALARGSKTDVSRGCRANCRVAGGCQRPAAAVCRRTAKCSLHDKGAILKRLASKAATVAMPDIEDVLRKRPSVWPRCSIASPSRLWSSARCAAAARPRHLAGRLHPRPSSGAPHWTTTT